MFQHVKFYISLIAVVFTFFAISALLTPQSSRASASASCGFSAIGDWTCPQGLGTASGGIVPGASTVTDPFSSGGLFNDPVITGGATCMAGVEVVLNGLFNNASAEVQAIMVNMLSGVNLCALSTSDIMSLITALAQIQDLLQSGIPSSFTCLNGVVAAIDNPGAIQQAVISQFTNIDLLDLIDGKISAQDQLNQVTEVAKSQICGDGVSGSVGQGSCSPVGSSIDSDIIAHLKLREGIRSCAYQDSLGKWTIGVGHLIVPGDGLNSSSCITSAKVDSLLQQDMQSAKSAAMSQMQQIGIDSHDFLVALTSVNYQLGTGWTSKFPNTWNTIKSGQFSEGADSLNGTKWQSQTPVRVTDFQTALHDLEACASGSVNAFSTASITPYSQPSNGYQGEAPPTCLTKGVNGWNQTTSNQALQIAATDTHKSGQCAAGTKNILRTLGMLTSTNVSATCDSAAERGCIVDGTDMDEFLLEQGWSHMNVEPQNAPVGCVLVFDNNYEYSGTAYNNGKGAQFGHVEIVVTDQTGARKYVSDKARNGYGGSVKENYRGCYYQTAAASSGSSDAACMQVIGASSFSAPSTPSMPELSALATAFGFSGFPSLSEIIQMAGVDQIPGLSQVQSVISDVQSLADNLQSTLDSVTGALTSVEQQLQEQLQQFDAVVDQIQNLQVISDLQLMGVNLEQLTDIPALQAIDDVMTDIANIQAEIDAGIKDATTGLAEIQSKLEDFDTFLNALNAEIPALEIPTAMLNNLTTEISDSVNDIMLNALPPSIQKAVDTGILAAQIYNDPGGFFGGGNDIYLSDVADALKDVALEQATDYLKDTPLDEVLKYTNAISQLSTTQIKEQLKAAVLDTATNTIVDIVVKKVDEQTYNVLKDVRIPDPYSPGTIVVEVLDTYFMGKLTQSLSVDALYSTTSEAAAIAEIASSATNLANSVQVVFQLPTASNPNPLIPALP